MSDTVITGENRLVRTACGPRILIHVEQGRAVRVWRAPGRSEALNSSAIGLLIGLERLYSPVVCCIRFAARGEKVVASGSASHGTRRLTPSRIN